MSDRRHHNNTGLRQIQRGKTRTQVEHIAKRLGIPVAPTPTPRCQCKQLGTDAPCGWCDGPDRTPTHNVR